MKNQNEVLSELKKGNKVITITSQLLSITKSEGLYLQMVGRGLRLNNETQNPPLQQTGVKCCVCGMELTIEENEENLTYDVRERICNKCNSELIKVRNINFKNQTK